MLKKVTDKQILESVNNLPVLSEVVNRSIAMLNDSECSIRDLTDLISKDQSITAKIIKMANSAFYGYPRQIRTLSEAIVILGFRQIRTLLITASTSTHLNGTVEGYMIAKGELWKHSYAVAYVAGLISKLSEKAKPDEAFTVGILHDIGKLILGNFLKGSYSEVVKLANKNKINFAIAEEKLLGIHHAEVGGRILEKWNFPEFMAFAVRKHHNPLESDDNKALIGIVNLADTWVREFGIGIGNNEDSESLEKSIIKELDIDETVKKHVEEYLSSEMKQMGDLFPSDNKEVKLVEISEQ
jgi:putative nucleotidyltransferase with HDIG domain